ncbi:hypothetical protein GTW37_28360, partial [Streptomyces sp. SID4931]|nr:hypothetical protein [Streptomyces sp. SID4931]
IAGPVAVAVPLLAVLAHFRPRLLVPVAFAAMAAAGVVGRGGHRGRGTTTGEGAFGATAQLLALIGLFAALVTVGREPLGRRAVRAGQDTAEPAPAGEDRPTVQLPAQPAPPSGRTLSADGRHPAKGEDA